MGVLACHKNGCENIMCNTLVEGIYYICDDCQKDFDKYVYNKHKKLRKGVTVMGLFIKFMSKPKREIIKKELEIPDIPAWFRQYDIR